MLNESVVAEQEELSTLDGRFLTFQIDAEMYGIEIRYVMEIIGIQAVTVMPEMPEYIKGIINLRGKIVPIMDIRLRFQKPARAYDDRTCIIVIDLNNVTVGLVVDSVSEVLVIPEEDISARPNTGGADMCGYIRNIGKSDNDIILIVDCVRLLSSEELNVLAEIQ